MDAFLNAIIEFLGRDTLIFLFVYTGSVQRAGNGKKVPVAQGLLLAFTPCFVVTCILYLIEGMVGLVGLTLAIKILAPLGGLLGFLGNFWVSGLKKDGKRIEEVGAAESMKVIAKSIINLFSKSE